MIYRLFYITKDSPCICDGFDRKEVEATAISFLEERYPEGGDEFFILKTYNEDTGEETEETIVLEWSTEDDGYDFGRFDYNSGIGRVVNGRLK